VPTTNNNAMDTVSYWDGDNLSSTPGVVLDLSDQKAFFYKGGTLAGVSMICSGDENHPTETGNFKITQKNKFHKSNLYGDFVDAAGNVVVANVAVQKDKAPPRHTVRRLEDDAFHGRASTVAQGCMRASWRATRPGARVRADAGTHGGDFLRQRQLWHAGARAALIVSQPLPTEIGVEELQALREAESASRVDRLPGR